MSLFNFAKSIKKESHILGQFPVAFLSYDEPNADQHWDHLRKNRPGNLLQRVHKVKGFDAAHKAAAAAFSNASHVITVDADNLVDLNFFNLHLHANIELPISYSWNGYQHTNGLVYGNGGIKLWNRQHLETMRSHEAADNKRDAVDFCWDGTQYKTLSGCWSTTFTNASAYQAPRVGFREGVKLSMDQGNVVPFDQWTARIHGANFQRLLTWMTVGADVDNGAWTIYGARLAVKLLQYDDWDPIHIRDYEWFEDFFKNHSKLDPVKANLELSKPLSAGLGFTLPEFSAEHSAIVKRMQFHANKELTDKDVKAQTNLKFYGWFNE